VETRQSSAWYEENHPQLTNKNYCAHSITTVSSKRLIHPGITIMLAGHDQEEQMLRREKMPSGLE
jgi:hypothetical protein